MNRRFFAVIAACISVVGIGVFVWSLMKDPGEQPVGVVQGEQVTAHSLVIHTIDGETGKPIGTVAVRVDEQPSSASASRSTVHQTVQTSETGIAQVNVPSGQYVLRSASAEWGGLLTAQITQDANLTLNLRTVSQE